MQAFFFLIQLEELKRRRRRPLVLALGHRRIGSDDDFLSVVAWLRPLDKNIGDVADVRMERAPRRLLLSSTRATLTLWAGLAAASGAGRGHPTRAWT